MKKAASRARFGFLVHDVSRMRRTYFDQALKPHGITRAQWWALGNLSRHAEDGMIQTELAKVLDTGKVSVGGLIDRLEDSGLVYRQNDAADRRVKRIFITEQGFAVLERIAVIGNQLDLVLFSDVTEAELSNAIDVMLRVKHNLRKALHGAVDDADLAETTFVDALTQAAPFRVSARASKPAAASPRRKAS